VLGVGYKINKRVRLDFGYTRRQVESAGFQRDRDFDQNIFDVALKLHP
jgi:hypothetical protein